MSVCLLAQLPRYLVGVGTIRYYISDPPLNCYATPAPPLSGIFHVGLRWDFDGQVGDSGD